MNELTVAGFRCFNEKQTARLAPLTILVGENSTGKTSFLALVRALWDVAIREHLPDFKDPPYDLGSFDEVAHYRGGKRANSFTAGFSMDTLGRKRPNTKITPYRYDITFRRDDAGVFPSIRRIEREGAWAECRFATDRSVSLIVATSNGRWMCNPFGSQPTVLFASPYGWTGLQRDLLPLGYLIHRFHWVASTEPKHLERRDGTEHPPNAQDLKDIEQLYEYDAPHLPRPFASAPVRSRPRRTYDPSQAIPDPEGDYVPPLLATAARKDSSAWQSMKQAIEEFGKDAGLFDEINIKVLGDTKGGPFQIQVRKFGKDDKGPHRNMIDVGYGVSQVLPLVTEVLRPQGPKMFLLQQPEVHLHPSAQAALGGLFCKAAAKQQFIIETHSDYLIDRIRTDIRDGNTELKPDDVSILFFQRRNLAVTIHSLGWDANGNLVAKRGQIPNDYRQFFRVERRRSLGL